MLGARATILWGGSSRVILLPRESVNSPQQADSARLKTMSKHREENVNIKRMTSETDNFHKHQSRTGGVPQTGQYFLHLTMFLEMIGQTVVLTILVHSHLFRGFRFKALGLPHMVKEDPSESR
jgi:hypothetical protein